MVPLFHPRRDVWSDHFNEAAGVIEGLAAAGRATAMVLAFNSPLRVELREAISLRDSLAADRDRR
jgi:hypothetical protein